MFTGQLAVVATPMRLIVDTDIGGGSCRDVDDVGAICMANALADNGEIDLLAVVVNTRPVQGVRAVAAINAWTAAMCRSGRTGRRSLMTVCGRIRRSFRGSAPCLTAQATRSRKRPAPVRGPTGGRVAVVSPGATLT